MFNNVHRGSWGTPDFGLTELAGGLISGLTGVRQTRTDQGGSQLLLTSPSDAAQVSRTTLPAASSTQQAYSSSMKRTDALPPQSAILGVNKASDTPSSPVHFSDLEGAAVNENDALLSSLNTEYDRNRETLLGARSDLEGSRTRALNTLGTEEQNLRTGVDRQQTASKEQVDQAIAEAGSTAKSIQQQNRNILRSLGILASSAAGELLSKPLNAFDQERARLVRAGMQRYNELEDYLNSGLSQLTNAKAEVEAKYASLVRDIENDLRFNKRDRMDAIQQANAALQNRINQIRLTAAQFTRQVATTQNSLLTETQKTLEGYDSSVLNPTMQGITNTRLQADGTGVQQVGVATDDEERKKLASGGLLLSGSAA